MPAEIYLNVAVSGVLTGLVYGLMALGLSVIFGVVRLVNFAHGEMMTIGMYLAVVLFATFGLDPMVMLVPIAAVLFAFGYVLQRRVVNSFVTRPESTQFLLMIGLAKRAEVCPFEVNLEAASRAKVVIGDYNYAFDPYVALTDFSVEADLSDTVLVVDEIHNLVDRGRRYYSPELSTRAARRVAEEAALGGEPIHDEIAALATRLAELIDRTAEDAFPGGFRLWAKNGVTI